MDVFFRHVGETNASSLMLGCAALGVLLLGRKLLPNKPVALLVVIGGIAAASFVDFGAHGVKLLDPRHRVRRRDETHQVAFMIWARIVKYREAWCARIAKRWIDALPKYSAIPKERPCLSHSPPLSA